MDKLGRSYLREINCSIGEVLKSEWEEKLRENHVIKSFIRSVSPFTRLLMFDNLLSRFRSGDPFGYVSCDLKGIAKFIENI